MSDCEQLITNGQIDEAIEIYKTTQPCTSHILKLIGRLYAEKKVDYHLAIYYFQQALDLEQKNNEDTSDTLSELGLVHQNLREYELALGYHFQALNIRQQKESNDPTVIVPNLFGIANGYWGQEKLSEALQYAQQALTINLSVKSNNEMNIATNMAILTNIYFTMGDGVRALELAKQALTMFQHSVSSDSLVLTTLLTNIGSIEIQLGLFDDALLTFIRVLRIYEKHVSENHPNRLAIMDSIQRLSKKQNNDGIKSINDCRRLLSKLLLS